MDNAARPDDIGAPGVHQSGRQDVKVVRDAVDDDGVAGIVTALGAATQLRLVSEDIGELSFALVAPLGAEHDGDGHRGKTKNVGGERRPGLRRFMNCACGGGQDARLRHVSGGVGQ